MSGTGGYIGSVLGGLAGGAAGLTAMAAIARNSPLAPMKLDIAHGMYRAGAAAGSEAEDWIRNRTFSVVRCILTDALQVFLVGVTTLPRTVLSSMTTTLILFLHSGPQPMALFFAIGSMFATFIALL